MLKCDDHIISPMRLFSLYKIDITIARIASNRTRSFCGEGHGDQFISSRCGGAVGFIVHLGYGILDIRIPWRLQQV